MSSPSAQADDAERSTAVPMRILFVETGTTGFGGSFQSLLSTLHALKRDAVWPIAAFLNEPVYCKVLMASGYSVYRLRDPVYSTDSGKLLRRVLEKSRYFFRSHLLSLGPYFEALVHLRTIHRLCRLVKQHGVSVVHMNTDVGRDFFGYWVGRFAQVPVVFHLRSRDNSGLSATKLRLLHSSRTISFVAISEFVRRSNARVGLNPDRIHVVHNASIREYSEGSILSNEKDEVFIDGHPGRLRVLFVGRLVSWKGADTLVSAFYNLTKTELNAMLYIVGSGPQEASLRRRVIEHGLGDRVSFLGYQANPEAYMRMSDLVVVPSINEPFGRVVLEAFHAYTPVVASNSGGIPELIEHGNNGLLFEPHNHEDLARQMHRVLTNPSLAKSLAKAARQTLRERFGQELYAHRLWLVYTRAIGSAESRKTP